MKHALGTGPGSAPSPILKRSKPGCETFLPGCSVALEFTAPWLLAPPRPACCVGELFCKRALRSPATTNIKGESEA
jgi:hypothetical protein